MVPCVPCHRGLFGPRLCDIDVDEIDKNPDEEDASRVAKYREWGSWMDNKVVDLVYTEPVKRAAMVKARGMDVDILDPSYTGLEPPVLDEKADAMDQRLKEMSTVAGKTAKARLVLFG